MKRGSLKGAFAYYVGLGERRRLQDVASHYGVSRRSVASISSREGWAARVAEHDRAARERAMRKAIDRATRDGARRAERYARAARQREERRLAVLWQYRPQSFCEAVEVIQLGMCFEFCVASGLHGHAQALLDVLIARAEHQRRQRSRGASAAPGESEAA